MNTITVQKSSATSFSDYLDRTEAEMKSVAYLMNYLRSTLRAERQRPLYDCEQEKKQKAKEEKRKAWIAKEAERVEKEAARRAANRLTEEEAETTITLEIGIEL